MEAAALPAIAVEEPKFYDPLKLWDDMEEHQAEVIQIRAKHEQFGPWAQKQYTDKYSWKDEAGQPTEVWPDTAYRVVLHELGALGYTAHDPEFRRLVQFITERKLLPGGRKLAQAGRIYHQTNNCFLYRVEDSREGWADAVWKAVMALSSGGGIGFVYSDVRARGTSIRKTGGVATGPLSPAKMVNETAREIMGGGMRRSAIWGGLHWWHPDVFEWMHVKDWPDEIKEAKRIAVEKGDECPAPMDMTNISIILDTEFFDAYYDEQHERHELANAVYWEAVTSMVSTGEPGFSIDCGDNEGENLRNACTEICSADDSDVCNLGSINMARVESLDEFKELVSLSTLLLLAGTVYSDVPHDSVKAAREKNRRLGLGLMGLHEWLLVRGHKYGMARELHIWLEEYAKSTEIACEWADKHNLSHPIKTRAIAPTGTIGIIAETTTGVEPIMAAAYKRRFLDTDGKWKYQYVIDPTAHRIITEHDVDPDNVEDSYTLAYDIERRIRFQAELQGYVDHAISSTLNLPYPITDLQEVKEFGKTLMRYLPKLRGITCYPNGARAGQPLEAVPYSYALGKTGVTFEDDRSGQCASGSCGV